jgi:glucose-1-phosphatase
MSIKNLLFDFGNVLFDIDLPAIERSFRGLIGDRFDAVWTELNRQQVFHLYETGGLSTSEFVDAIRFAAQPTQISEEQVVNAWNSIFIGMPRDRFDLLLRLRQRYQVFLLSNINDLHANWIDDYMVREHGIHDFQLLYFDGVYYSHLIRLRKPDADAFEYVLADTEIKAEDTLFIDDLTANVAAARQLGIEGIVHIPHASLEYLEQMNK